ncbi:hypothetical protein OZX60_06595 [Streptococcaceae bacterium ESL0687]|nr:hypothetical protein OZX60_06595 [Streptococcaceae bacterium ESL0687]
MKKKILTLACLLGLTGLAGFQFLGNTKTASANELQTVSSQQVNLVTTDLLAKSDHDEEEHEKGMGYHWKCWTCGYYSNKHILASTAVSAANDHANRYEHRTSVIPN